MDFIEKTMEMRAIRRSEFIDYFTSINGRDTGSGKITGDGWEAEVSEERLVPLGPFKVIATIVVLRCKKELFEKMYKEFRMKFFRAGG